jgi:hypothetical protein
MSVNPQLEVLYKVLEAWTSKKTLRLSVNSSRPYERNDDDDDGCGAGDDRLSVASVFCFLADFLQSDVRSTYFEVLQYFVLQYWFSSHASL